MQLTSFEVRGFKNLVAPIKIDALLPINVFHGANNVGKSNLLHAIEVLFRCFGFMQSDEWLPITRSIEVSEERLGLFHIKLQDIFNYSIPSPIELAASISIPPSELSASGIRPLIPCHEVSIKITLESLDNALSIQVQSFRFADGTEATAPQSSRERKEFVLRFANFLMKRFLGSRGMPHVDVDRRAEEAVDALYDASTSTDRRTAMQWDRFVEVMAKFRDILGEGRFLAVLPREAKHARLLYETKTMRIPMHALGSGAQQIIALFGHLLTLGAPIVAIEEPELNLRWSVQERVRDILHDLVGKEGAPAQIFLTSHAGTFEYGKEFFLMQATESGPSVERRPLSQLSSVLGGACPERNGKPPRVPIRASSEGIVRLPERILSAMHIEQGGDISFVDKGEGVVEMMSDETFLKRAGLDEDGDDA